MSIRYVSASCVTSFALLLCRSALAEEPTPSSESPAAREDAILTARRLNVERAEQALALRKREVDVVNQEHALDRAEAARTRPPTAPNRFSRAGRVVLPRLAGFTVQTGSLAGLGAVWNGIVSFSTGSSKVGSNRQSTTGISFNPSVDVFVSDHWTVGGVAQVSRLTQTYEYGPSTLGPARTESSGYGVTVTPRVGRTFDLGSVTVWPKLGAGYGVSRTEGSGDQVTGRTIQRSLFASLDVDVVLRLSPNVFLDMGPTFSYVHTSGESNTSSDWRGADSDIVSAGVQSHLGVTF